MILLMITIWAKVGGGLLSEVGTIFSSGERSGGFEGLGSFGAFLAVFSIMVGYFAAVVINFGDFARFVKNEDEMKKGNFIWPSRKCNFLLFHNSYDYRWINCSFRRIHCSAN
jgi:NCS1 family nucleobase:cation symporter-1